MNYEIELDDLEESVCEEMNGPGNLLGYYVLTKRIREIHVQKVLRNLVYAMTEHVDPSGLKKLIPDLEEKNPKYMKQTVFFFGKPNEPNDRSLSIKFI